MARGFLEDSKGNKSNSRLIGDMLIGFAMAVSVAFIIIKIIKPEIDLINLAQAIGLLFGTVAGMAMTFLGFQKRTENKEQL